MYSAPSSPGAFNPAVTGSSATPAAWNTLLDDIETALSTVICKDGQTTVTANIPMSTFKFTGLGAGTTDGDSVRYEQLTAFYGTQPIGGLTYANNSVDVTNDIDIAVGSAIDATGAYAMTLASALTKKSDVAWAVGTDQGALDTGTVENNDYYMWLIARSDTGVVDVLFSLSATAPTMPANYDYKELFGFFSRSAGAIVTFTTYELAGGGLEFHYRTPTFDIDLSNTLTTSRRTDALRVPLYFSVEAIIRVYIEDAFSVAVARICCPDETDAAVALGGVTPGANITTTTTYFPSVEMHIRTSATGTIAARASLATVDVYRVWTVGFKWSRR